MNSHELFFNQDGRLRSGWRFGIFALIYLALMFWLTNQIRVAYHIGVLLNLRPSHFLQDLVFRVMLLGSALLVGWICNRWLEDLPWRALGLTFHAHWLRDLLVGSLIGGASLALAALIALVAGGLRFTAPTSEIYGGVLQTLLLTALLFIIAALAEESLFRGYPLQTMTRAGLVWFGILVTSTLLFAAMHLQNPNLTAFSFINTAFAGIWLAAAYLRTRSLWFPLGVHWAWNWAQGSIFGLPVSGANLAAHPLLRASDHGPAWLTGGSYGIEGGIACTAALLVSTLFIWRTRLVCATTEMKLLTSQENPVAPKKSYTPLQTTNGDDSPQPT